MVNSTGAFNWRVGPCALPFPAARDIRVVSVGGSHIPGTSFPRPSSCHWPASHTALEFSEMSVPRITVVFGGRSHRQTNAANADPSRTVLFLIVIRASGFMTLWITFVPPLHAQQPGTHPRLERNELTCMEMNRWALGLRPKRLAVSSHPAARTGCGAGIEGGAGTESRAVAWGPVHRGRRAGLPMSDIISFSSESRRSQ